MLLRSLAKIAIISTVSLGLAGCGGKFGGFLSSNKAKAGSVTIERSDTRQAWDGKSRQSSVLDLFSGGDDANTTVGVNKYIWNAALDVLNFLPIESVDPFTGVIVTGYGTPPGGGRAYRATILIQDPALDARSLKLSLQTQGGAVSPETLSAIEDAILTRARQLRIADSKL
jgi:hypothetical protein